MDNNRYAKILTMIKNKLSRYLTVVAGEPDTHICLVLYDLHKNGSNNISKEEYDKVHEDISYRIDGQHVFSDFIAKTRPELTAALLDSPYGTLAYEKAYENMQTARIEFLEEWIKELV